MKYLRQVGAASIVALCVAVPAARAQGRDVAFDFKSSETTTMQGNTTKGESTAHAVMSQGRLRFEMAGNSRMTAIPGFTPGSTIVMILPDNGNTFILLQPDKKQYMKINPSAMIENLQKMMESMGSTMTFEITGDDPKVENLGAGPDVMGHHTQHWRVTSNAKVKVGAMGQIQSTEINTVSDEYIAPDVTMLGNPFRGIQSNPMGDMFGSSAKTYTDKLLAARKKITAGTPLRTEQTAKTDSPRGPMVSSAVMEITKIQSVNATPDMFEIPPGYTEIKFPMPGAPPGGKTN